MAAATNVGRWATAVAVVALVAAAVMEAAVLEKVAGTAVAAATAAEVAVGEGKERKHGTCSVGNFQVGYCCTKAGTPRMCNPEQIGSSRRPVAPMVAAVSAAVMGARAGLVTVAVMGARAGLVAAVRRSVQRAEVRAREAMD